MRAAAEIIAKIKCRIICVIIEQEQPLLMVPIKYGLRRLPYPSSNSDNSEDCVYGFGCSSTNEIDRES